MSEIKTIKGRVDFVCVPIDEYGCYTEEHEDEIKNISNILDWFLLSEITEQQASLLVEDPIMYMGYLLYENYQSEPRAFETAKESLFSLLKANGCCTKDMFNDDYEHLPITRSAISEILPDDYLLIITQ